MISNSFAIPFYEEVQPLEVLRDRPAEFDAWFSRCEGLLISVARRVLGGEERVEEVLGNCWKRACSNPSQFESEGAFRSWLLRILIDEALVTLREAESSVPVLRLENSLGHPTPTGSIHHCNLLLLTID